MTFDPNAAAQPDSGIFGLPTPLDDALIEIIPVPFDATTSYGHGAALGPGAILEASRQVDLHDPVFGDVFTCGIFMGEIPETLAALSREARAAAEPIIAKGGAEPARAQDAAAVRLVNEASQQIERHTHRAFSRAFAAGRVPALLGGDHSTPLGAIRAAAEFVAGLAAAGDRDAARGLGVLHIDAHLDLRVAFEGFAQSHASIMHNVLAGVPGVTRLVSVGIRDFCAAERDAARAHGPRVRTFFDHELAARTLEGRFAALVEEILAALPPLVHVSFDIDGLDPALCPHTGTPVPGGLSFHQITLLLDRLARSGKRVVSFDLVEVAPGPEGDWDANVGARILYKLCGVAAAGRAESPRA